MPSRWLDNGNTGLKHALGQVPGMGQPIGQIVLVYSLPQPSGNGLQVTTRQATIGREAFAKDQFLAGPLIQILVVHAQETTDVNQGILLGTHCAAIGVGKSLLCDLQRAFVSISWFAQLNKVGILRLAACIDKDGEAVPVQNLRSLPDILHRHRLTAPRVVRYGEHDQRYIILSRFQDKIF